MVDSVPEAIAHLEKDQNAEFYRAGELTYRGQTREFTVRRPVPNPAMRNASGEERLVLPGAWRPYVQDFTKRPVDAPPAPWFEDPVLGAGIPEGALDRLAELAQFGHWEISEMLVRGGMADDATARERWRVAHGAPRRYQRATEQGRALGQLPLLQQHYGVPTTGLGRHVRPAKGLLLCAA